MIDINEILLLAIPALISALVVIAFVAFRLLRLAERQSFYKEDKFRLSVEKEISRLSHELTYSRERFEKVNHLLLDTQRAGFSSGKNNSKNNFLERMGVDTNAKVDPEYVFVLMPFHPEFDKKYSVIERAVRKLGFRCSRGDTNSVSSNIMSHILNEIFRAKLIIADVGTRNPNVFYELGIAHAIGKPVVMISESESQIPFDISSTRILFYNTSHELEKNITKWLPQMIAHES